MLKLLNRLAWFLSLVSGYLVILSLSGLGSSRIGDDEVAVSLFFGLFAGMIIKKVFFSKAFITSRLEFLAEALGDRFGSNQSSKDSFETIIKKDTTEENPVELNVLDKLDGYKEKGEELISNAEEKGKVLLSKAKESVNELHEKREERKTEREEVVHEPSKFRLAISKFFSENLLAKLGGILIFLGVLFFLSLLYAGVGPVGKVIIGFAIGFGIYATGIWLDKKDYSNEGRILLGIGILINYLVILGGRHLIGDSAGGSFLSDSTAFIFLIFNTVFAVVTSLVYKSRTLLLFSFIFAYINPFLVGGNMDTPYLLVGYSLIVSAGGLFLGLKQKDQILTYGVFILSNLLILSAPVSTDLHWIVKLLSSTIMAVSSVAIMYNLNKNSLIGILILAYMFIILLLGGGIGYISELTSYISYMISITILFVMGVICFIRTGINSLLSLIIFPVIILLGLSAGGLVVSIPLTLVLIVFMYLIGFSFMESKMGNAAKYFFFVFLGIYIFCTNSVLTVYTLMDRSITMDLVSLISVLFVSFVFLFTTYFLSQKKGLEYLFSIGTVGGVLMLAPVLSENSDAGMMNLYFSIIAVVLFAVSKWIIPFVYEDFFQRKHNIKNIVVGVLVGLIFVGYELFVFGSNYFPGVLLGFAFTGLASLYFFIAYMIIGKLGIENVKTNSDSKNAVAVYMGAAISLFTLAVALVFSKYEGVISAIWLFEATILIFVYNRIRETKIMFAGIILFMIGLLKLSILVDVVDSRDYIFLVPLTLIAISFILNLRYLNFLKTGGIRVFHDILHIIGVGIIGLLLLIVIPNTGMGWSLLGIATFISIASMIYAHYDSRILKTFFVLLFVGITLYHFSISEYTFSRVERAGLDYLKVLQYGSTILLGFGIFMWNKLNKVRGFNIAVNLILGLYLLAITTVYVYDIFDTTFAVTIYWGIVASVLITRGIAKDRPDYRTIGMYLIVLTSLKIFTIDIWYGIDDAISRVVALMFLGFLFIFISTRLTNKFGNNIISEFNLSNLVGGSAEKQEIKKEESL